MLGRVQYICVNLKILNKEKVRKMFKNLNKETIKETVLVCAICIVGFQLGSLVPTYSDLINNEVQPVGCEVKSI
jgi:hypothetical protein